MPSHHLNHSVPYPNRVPSTQRWALQLRFCFWSKPACLMPHLIMPSHHLNPSISHPNRVPSTQFVGAYTSRNVEYSIFTLPLFFIINYDLCRGKDQTGMNPVSWAITVLPSTEEAGSDAAISSEGTHGTTLFSISKSSSSWESFTGLELSSSGVDNCASEFLASNSLSKACFNFCLFVQFHGLLKLSFSKSWVLWWWVRMYLVSVSWWCYLP